MKESVLDVLIFLFENNFDPEANLSNSLPTPMPAEFSATGANDADREVLTAQLSAVGFDSRQVEGALEWLDALAADIEQPMAAPAARALRVFDARECARLDTDCRNYILYLENVGILDATRRELALDRLMALDCESIGLEQVKWVVLLVLFSQPEQELSFLRMEGLVFEQRVQGVH